eukprot:45240_1
MAQMYQAENNNDNDQKEGQNDNVYVDDHKEGQNNNFTTGMMLQCNDRTEGECFVKQLFGATSVYLNDVKSLPQKSCLFLYNTHSKCLKGIFESVGNGGEYLDENAWRNSYYKFPAQVHFRTIHQFEQPIHNNQFRHVFTGWDKTRRTRRLNAKEIKQLLELFVKYQTKDKMTLTKLQAIKQIKDSC